MGFKKLDDVVIEIEEIPGTVIVPSEKEVKKRMRNAFFGRLYFWTETGTEGGRWALIKNGSYSDLYSGLYVLRDGDYLEIYKTKTFFRKEIVWRGIIDFENYGVFNHGIFGFWIHSAQKGVDMREWASYFFDEYRAMVIPNFIENNNS